MDKTETYIKMCDCPEIQDAWMPDDTDFIQDSQGMVYVADLECLIGEGHRTESIWLPRQDQLQEMYICHLKAIDKANRLANPSHVIYGEYVSPTLNHFHLFVCRISLEDMVNSRYSMEQLWLAFVMKEKHNKTWTGTEWKEDEHGRKEGLQQ